MLHTCEFLISHFESNKINVVGDNGFIPVDKLGDVLDELDLTSKVGDNGVQTLKAYLEVGFTQLPSVAFVLTEISFMILCTPGQWSGHYSVG